LIDAGISLATAHTPVDGDGSVEQLGDAHIAGNDGTRIVAADVTFLDVLGDGALRRYSPLPGNRRD
jgi:hypothetical protein